MIRYRNRVRTRWQRSAGVFSFAVALADDGLSTASTVDPDVPIKGFKQGSENEDFHADLKEGWQL